MNNDISKLFVIGINHKTSTLFEREKFQINKNDLSDALMYMMSMTEVEGAVIVSTCNRLEFYLVLVQNADPFWIISDFYLGKGIMDTCESKNKFYLYEGIDAAKHLLKVSAGLDSMVLGEYQVLGQIKDAYSIACSANAADKILHKLFHTAFRAGKAVRTKTKISSYNKSLSHVAFNIIKEKLRKENVITIVGVNQNTKIIAEKLYKAGYRHLIFVNRKLYKAEELAEKFNGIAFSLDCIEEAMISTRCILSCTGAPGYIINSALINKVYSKSGNPQLLIDMAVPRDINTNGLIDDIKVIDLEELKKYLEEERKAIIMDLSDAEKIIMDEVEKFNVWNELQADESMSFLNEKIENVRLQLLDEKKPHLSTGEFELLDNFSRSLTHRTRTIITQAMKTFPAYIKINKED